MPTSQVRATLLDVSTSRQPGKYTLIMGITFISGDRTHLAIDNIKTRTFFEPTASQAIYNARELLERTFDPSVPVNITEPTRAERDEGAVANFFLFFSHPYSGEESEDGLSKNPRQRRRRYT